jgi:hypothetical protein
MSNLPSFFSGIFNNALRCIPDWLRREKRYFNPTSFRFQPMEYTFQSLERVFYPMEFIFYTVERKAYRCFVFQRTSGKMPMSGKITNFV